MARAQVGSPQGLRRRGARGGLTGKRIGAWLAARVVARSPIRASAIRRRPGAILGVGQMLKTAADKAE